MIYLSFPICVYLRPSVRHSVRIQMRPCGVAAAAAVAVLVNVKAVQAGTEAADRPLNGRLGIRALLK